MKMKLYVLSLWNVFDPVYYAFSRLTHINKDNSTHNNNVLRVRFTRYKGKDLVLSDGTAVKKNDLLIKIHLHNVRLLKEMHNLQSEVRKALLIYHKINDSLPQLASYIQHHEKNAEIKGIIGITMLNKGCERLGFEKHTISNRFYRWFKEITMIPIYLLSVSSGYRKKRKASQVSYLMMSKKVLLNKYSLVNP